MRRLLRAVGVHIDDCAGFAKGSGRPDAIAAVKDLRQQQAVDTLLAIHQVRFEGGALGGRETACSSM